MGLSMIFLGENSLRCVLARAIRQEPREERIGNTVERGDDAGARQNATPQGP